MDALKSCPLSVVMPVYNEAAGLERVVDDVRRHVLDRVPGAEFVIVDDCSVDGSANLLARFAEQDSRIRVLVNTTNSGHGPSLRRAIDQAAGAWVFHLDSDGQVDVSEFVRLWELRNEVDLVLGGRVRRHDPRHRLVLTRLTRIVVSLAARRGVRDGNVPFKLFRRSLFDHLSGRMPPDAFAPSLMLAVGAVRCGARVLEIETTHLPRQHGRSSLHLKRLAAAIIRSTRETVAFSRHPFPPFSEP